MVKTKTKQIVDAQNNIEEEVYFSILSEEKDYARNTVTFLIQSKIKVNTEDEGGYTYRKIKNTRAIFKLSTFNNIFGGLTIQEYEDTKDQLLINQIDYINKHTWTGKEPMPKNSYWNLVKTDLEVVSL